jgi:hypothetical protein
MKTTTSGDGARAFSTWHDDGLGVDCYFSTATDGATRCLPTTMAYIGIFYADATCSTLLGYTGCGAAPAFAESTVGCGESGSTYYSLGAPYSGATYILSGTTCTELTEPVLDPLFSVGAAVPASAFVEGTLAE